jgi:hypothetical protein
LILKPISVFRDHIKDKLNLADELISFFAVSNLQCGVFWVSAADTYGNAVSIFIPRLSRCPVNFLFDESSVN